MFFFFDLKVQSVLKIRLLQKNQKGFFHNSPTPLDPSDPPSLRSPIATSSQLPKRGFNHSSIPSPIFGKGLNRSYSSLLH